MKKTAALAFLAFVSSGFCVDEYLPVEKAKTEVDLGYGFMSGRGDYDVDGKKQDYPSGVSSSGHQIPLQVKYGIMAGLDVEAAWAFQIASLKFPGLDTTLSGFGQPDIAVKYALMDIGLGAFVDFTLPFATGDHAKPDQPPAALSFGAVYTKLFMPQFNLTAMVDYKLNFEAKDSIKAGNVFTVYAKPEFRFNQFGGAYLGVRYDMMGEEAYNGTSISKTDGYLFTLAPGWNATWLPNVSTEVNVPYTLAGKNQTAYWGINLNVYVTLPK